MRHITAKDIKDVTGIALSPTQADALCDLRFGRGRRVDTPWQTLRSLRKLGLTHYVPGGLEGSTKLALTDTGLRAAELLTGAAEYSVEAAERARRDGTSVEDAWAAIERETVVAR